MLNDLQMHPTAECLIYNSSERKLLLNYKNKTSNTENCLLTSISNKYKIDAKQGKNSFFSFFFPQKYLEE